MLDLLIKVLKFIFVVIFIIGLNLIYAKNAKSFNETSLGVGIDPTVAGKFVAYTVGTSSHPIDDNGRGGEIVVRKLDRYKCYNKVVIKSMYNSGVGSPRLIYNSYLKKYELLYYDGNHLMLAFLDPSDGRIQNKQSELFYYFTNPVYIPQATVDNEIGDLYVVLQTSNGNTSFVVIDKDGNVVYDDKNILTGDKYRLSIGIGADKDVVIVYEDEGQEYFIYSFNKGKKFEDPRNICSELGLSNCRRAEVSPIVQLSNLLDNRTFLVIMQAEKDGVDGIHVDYNPFDNTTVIDFGPDQNGGEAVAISLVGITQDKWGQVHVQVEGS